MFPFLFAHSYTARIEETHLPLVVQIQNFKVFCKIATTNSSLCVPHGPQLLLWEIYTVLRKSGANANMTEKTEN